MISLRKAALAATLGFGVLTTGAIASATATPATLAAMEVALPRAEDTTPPTASARHPRAQAWLDSLTPEQRSCLKEAALTRPVGPLTDEERKSLREQIAAAAKKCDVTLPKGDRREKIKAFWQGLSDTQRDCLKDADISRPWGPLSPQERKDLLAKVRDAAKTCGVTLPSAA